MTTPPAAMIAASTPYRFAGRSAIASGVFALMTFGLLFLAVNIMLVRRPEQFGLVDLMFKAHKVGIICQYLFMIPVAIGLHRIASQRFPGMSQTYVAVGVVSLSLIVICALLFIVNVVADDLYLIPQGVLGVWLMDVNRRLSSVLPRGITRLGTVVGLGLLLVGTFPLAYGILVDPIGLRGPVPLDYPNPETTANAIIHLVFYIGTLMGVLPYPIWSILLGRQLLRARGF